VNIENFVMPEPEEVWQIIVDSAADLADALNDKLGEKRFTADRPGLRNLTFVMWKDIVFSAGVNIDGGPQQVRSHHRTLNVPPGKTYGRILS